jgi:hypothetical protein
LFTKIKLGQFWGLASLLGSNEINLLMKKISRDGGIQTVWLEVMTQRIKVFKAI